MGPVQTEQCASGAEPPPRTVTSRSLTLSGRGFRLDFTWRREERDQPASSKAAAQARSTNSGPAQYDRNARPVPCYQGPTPAAAARAPQAPVRPADATQARQSFAEIMRRQQLAGLVSMPSRLPAERSFLQGPLAMADPSPGAVCRAYGEALGPLGSPACRLFTA